MEVVIISQEERKSSTLFPKLNLLMLEDLPELRTIGCFTGNLIIKNCPQMQPQAMSSCLKNLTELTMVGFDNLKYLFPSSMAESLVHLEFLNISNCKQLMEVVIITQEERKSSTLFPKLNQLLIKDLPELTTFCCFTGNLIKLPSLNELYINNFPKMQRFATEEEPEEVNTQKEENLPSFLDEKVALPCLKKLWLHNLTEVLHLWKENYQPSKIFENLANLTVAGCGNLTTLLPSTVSLQNLMNLEVRKCDGLINLVPFSSLNSAEFEATENNDCKMIEEIIIDMGDEVKDNIVFDQLITLELHCLPSLTSFCKGNFTIEFPSLSQVFVMKCLKMMSFSQGVLSTPQLRRLELKEIDEGFGGCDEDEGFWDSGWVEVSWEGEEDERQWEGDLNTSIQQFFEDRNARILNN